MRATFDKLVISFVGFLSVSVVLWSLSLSRGDRNARYLCILRHTGVFLLPADNMSRRKEQDSGEWVLLQLYLIAHRRNGARFIRHRPAHLLLDIRGVRWGMRINGCAINSQKGPRRVCGGFAAVNQILRKIARKRTMGKFHSWLMSHFITHV